MYTTHFGLQEKPFSITPDPRYMYMSELHREALAHLIYGLQSDGCFLLFTGEIGTGKTTVCRCFLDQLPADTDIAIVLNPKVSVLDLLKTICEELAIPEDGESLSIKTYIDQLNSYLLNAHATGRKTVVVIDEAQNLVKDVLEQLRLLTNLETTTHKLLKIFLLGQPELRKILAMPEMLQLNQRITSRYHLMPLHREDIKQYIEHRLTVAGGGSRQFFSDAALKYIARLSKGIPRIINLLCDRALLGAYAEGAKIVNLKVARKAAQEVLETVRPGGERKATTFSQVALLLFLCVLSLPIFYYCRDIVAKTATRVLPHLEIPALMAVQEKFPWLAAGDSSGADAQDTQTNLIKIGSLKQLNAAPGKTAAPEKAAQDTPDITQQANDEHSE